MISILLWNHYHLWARFVVYIEVQTLLAIFNLPTHKLSIRSRPPTRSNLTVSIDPPVFLRSSFSLQAQIQPISQDEGSAENMGFKITNHYRQAAHSRLSKHKNSQTTLRLPSILMGVQIVCRNHYSCQVPLISEIFAPTFTTSATYPNGPTSLPHSSSDPLPTRREKSFTGEGAFAASSCTCHFRPRTCHICRGTGSGKRKISTWRASTAFILLPMAQVEDDITMYILHGMMNTGQSISHLGIPASNQHFFIHRPSGKSLTDLF